MASSAFKAALAAAKESKNLDRVLVGTSYLGEGTHDVTIQGVDTANVGDNKLNVTFQDAEGKSYTDRMFLTSQKGDFSYSVRLLWSGLFPDKEILGRFIDLVFDDDKALEIMTGMKLRITLAPGRGFQVRSTGTGGFAAFDVESGEKVTDEYEELEKAKDAAKAAGLKQSFLQIKKADATHVESNIAAFNVAAEARTKGVTQQSFSAGKAI